MVNLGNIRHIFSGNEIGILFGEYLITKSRNDGKIAVITTVVSSQMLKVDLINNRLLLKQMVSSTRKL